MNTHCQEFSHQGVKAKTQHQQELVAENKKKHWKKTSFQQDWGWGQRKRVSEKGE
jgi:hypothetical protein